MAAYLFVPIQHVAETLMRLDYKVFYGPNCISDFLTSLSNLAVEVGEWYQECANAPMTPLTAAQENDFKSTSVCYLCHKYLKNSDKARDHDHVSGAYLGRTQEM